MKPDNIPDEQQGVSLSIASELLEERYGQIRREGWDISHDDSHSAGEMARAAASYAYMASLPTEDEREAHRGAVYGIMRGFTSIVVQMWPWAPRWLKPKDRRRDLVRAGALIIAEIERLDRKAGRS